MKGNKRKVYKPALTPLQLLAESTDARYKLLVQNRELVATNRVLAASLQHCSTQLEKLDPNWQYRAND